MKHTQHLFFFSLFFLTLFLLQFSFAAQSTALSIIDSPLRQQKPMQPDDIEKLVFGLRFDELDIEAECHVDVDVQWMTNVGSKRISGAPLVGDFRNDGKKEIVVVSNDYVEVIEGEDGRKEPGWPFYIPDKRFAAGAIDYDLAGASSRDLLLTTEHEMFFLTEDGYPYHGATLKPPPLIVPKDWYVEFKENNQTMYKALYADLPSRAQRIKESEKNTQKFIDVYEKYREEMSARLPSGQFKTKYKDALAFHIADQKEKVEKHISKLNQVFQRRKFLGIDETGDKFEEISKKLSSASHTFEGVQGWLTNEGLESLELFLPTETGSSFVTQLRSAADPLFSPQYESYIEVMKIDEMDLKNLSLVAKLNSKPVIVDLEGDGHNEIIVAVNYGLSPSIAELSSKNPELRINPAYYVANAIVAFDMMIHQVKWISPLELSSGLERYRAMIFGTPTIIDLDGDESLDIVFGTAMGHIYVLDNFGCLKPEFPIAMNTLAAPIIVEDIDQDGTLDIIAVDIISTLVVYDNKGKQKWSKFLTPGCIAAPSIGDVNGDGNLDIVLACNSGVIHVIDCYGNPVSPFPILQESGMRGSPLLMKMKQDTSYLHILSMSPSGHLYIIDGKDACTEVVDLGGSTGFRSPMIISDDVTGNGMLDLIVSSGQQVVYTLSTDVPYHPLNAWTKEAHGRNVFTTTLHQGIYFLQNDRVHRDIVGDEFWINFEIVDNRKNRDRAYYEVQIKLRRDLDPIYSGRYTTTGIKSVSLPVPSMRMSGTLRIEMTNEHQQFFHDSITLTFNMRFYRSIKWMIVLPFTLCAIFVFYLKRELENMQFEI